MSSKDERGRGFAGLRKAVSAGVPSSSDQEIDPEMLAMPQPQDDEIDPETLAMPQPGEDEIDPETLAMPRSVPQPDTRRSVVTIYVRKGDHSKERTISINPIPPGIDPIDLLNAGFAVDGNSATISIDPYTFVTHHTGKDALSKSGLHDEIAGTSHVASFDHWVPGGILPGEWAATWTLTKALANAEMALVGWLELLGYKVKFG